MLICRAQWVSIVVRLLTESELPQAGATGGELYDPDVSLRLVPTVEFEPCHWTDIDVTSLIAAPEWDESWRRVLAERRVAPFLPGSWYVAVEAVTDPDTLDRLVELALSRSVGEGSPDHDGENPGTVVDHELDDEDLPLPINGGYALVSSGAVLVMPSCCCDLGDLNDWRRAAGIRDGTSQCLFVGHATVCVEREGTRLTVIDHPESIGEDAVSAVVLVDDLVAAVEVAETVVRAFRERLRPAVARRFPRPSQAEQVASSLTGLPVV
jgi:hypothetical protein